MSAYKDLEDSLYDYLHELFPDWQIVFALQNGPEPQTPYLSLDIRKHRAQGRESSSTLVCVNDVGEAVQTIQHYIANVRLTLVGKNDTNSQVATMAFDLENVMRSPRAYALQRQKNLSLFRLSSLERIPMKRETDLYLYFQLDVELGFAVERTDIQDWIAGTSVTGVYRDAGQLPDHTIVSTIEIP